MRGVYEAQDVIAAIYFVGLRQEIQNDLSIAQIWIVEAYQFALLNEKL